MVKYLTNEGNPVIDMPGTVSRLTVEDCDT
jgi:hypothetical protein